MTAWLSLNSIGLALVGAILYLVLRQLGFVLNRVGPVGARSTPEGPRIGENLMHHVPELGAVSSQSRSKLIVFVSDSCSVCKRIRSGAEELSRFWHHDADILLVYDAADESDQTRVQQISPGLFVKRDQDLRPRLGAMFVPFGIVTDRQGNVVSKALVNEIAHLESLLEAEREQRTAAANGTAGNSTPAIAEMSR
jgi:methylamine dehydrogenase accessory protein MauD